jgi:general secretion pathway protein I
VRRQSQNPLPATNCPGARGASGFSLIELIVATAIMGMAVVGLITLISVALRQAAEVRQYDRAAMLARTQMNQLLVLDPLPLGRDLAGAFDGNSGWQARAEPFEWAIPGRETGDVLVRIPLRVWWEKDGQRRDVQLEGYRLIRIRQGGQ